MTIPRIAFVLFFVCFFSFTALLRSTEIVSVGDIHGRDSDQMLKLSPNESLECGEVFDSFGTRKFFLKDGGKYEGLQDLTNLRSTYKVVLDGTPQKAGYTAFMISGVSFKQANLSGSSFDNILFSDTSFEKANLQGAVIAVDATCRFENARISGSHEDDDKPRYSSAALPAGAIIYGMTTSQLCATSSFRSPVQKEPPAAARCCFINCVFTFVNFSKGSLYRTQFGTLAGPDGTRRYADVSRSITVQTHPARKISLQLFESVQNEFNDKYSAKNAFLTNCSFAYADLRKSVFANAILKNCSFRNADLRGAKFENCTMEGNCSFDEADIRETELAFLSKEQIARTKSFRQGELTGIRFSIEDLKDFRFTKCNLTGSVFCTGCDLTGADFTDAVITNCKFTDTYEDDLDGTVLVWVKTLTLEQVKSTWNYKYGQLDDIDFPPDIRAALDKEKQASGQNAESR